MKKTIIAFAAIVAMAGCNKSLIETSEIEDSQYGYINLGVTADTEMLVTKSGTETPTYTTVETPTGWNIKLLKKETENSEAYNTPVWTENDGFKEYTSDGYKVVAGNYKIYAENLTATEAENGLGKVRYAGTSDEPFEVKAGANATAEVNCSVINSKVSVTFADGFTKVFVDPEVVVKDENTNSVRACTLTPGATASFWNVEAENRTLTWSLEATVGKTETETGTRKKFTPSSNNASITLSPKQHAKISLASNNNGTLNVTIRINENFVTTTTVTETIDPTTGEAVQAS